MNKKYWLAALLALLMIIVCGCDQPVEDPQETTEPAVTQTDPVTEPQQTGDASLNGLRQSMVETPQVFAAAYLGYQEPGDPREILLDHAPWLCEDLTFLLEIPEERIIGQSGDMFCIVPLDEDATVAVSRGYWDDENSQYIYDDILYSSSTGEPVIVFCNDSGGEPDTQIWISGPSGEVYWELWTDDNGCAMPLRNDDGEDLFKDLSPYRELLMARHRGLKDSDWGMPTAERLIGTTWNWAGWTKDGREVSCRLVFEEDILSVVWNDGMDEMDHEYLYAPWALTYDEGFAILEIDFGEFAGVLRYDVLWNNVHDELYVAMDVVQEEMNIGWEPLFRFMELAVAPEPVEMIGLWEQAWTEVEGCREEVEPGAVTIEIRTAASAGLLMSYTSRDFPRNNFENELLTIDMRQMHTLCGNDEWVADLDYVGPYDTTYAVTLTTDGILIKQNYFLLDGAPSVSYEYFRRAE